MELRPPQELAVIYSPVVDGLLVNAIDASAAGCRLCAWRDHFNPMELLTKCPSMRRNYSSCLTEAEGAVFVPEAMNEKTTKARRSNDPTRTAKPSVRSCADAEDIHLAAVRNGRIRAVICTKSR